MKDTPKQLSIANNPAIWKVINRFWDSNPEFRGRVSNTLSYAINNLLCVETTGSPIPQDTDEEPSCLDDEDWC